MLKLCRLGGEEGRWCIGAGNGGREREDLEDNWYQKFWEIKFVDAIEYILIISILCTS